LIILEFDSLVFRYQFTSLVSQNIKQ